MKKIHLSSKSTGIYWNWWHKNEGYARLRLEQTFIIITVCHLPSSISKQLWTANKRPVTSPKFEWLQGGCSSKKCPQGSTPHHRITLLSTQGKTRVDEISQLVHHRKHDDKHLGEFCFVVMVDDEGPKYSTIDEVIIFSIEFHQITCQNEFFFYLISSLVIFID